MKIIGISGKKQSGKTTAVGNIARRICKTHRFREICMADTLKCIVQKCFGATHANLYGSDKEKNEVLSCGRTARELLQYIGTNVFRNIDPNCWITAYITSVKEQRKDSVVLTPDVRFPNEVKCIQELGGHVIRLLRNPHDDKHESETALDGIETETMLTYEFPSYAPIKQTPRDPNKIYFDAIIDNRKMSIEQQNEAVWKLVNEKGWT